MPISSEQLVHITYSTTDCQCHRIPETHYTTSCHIHLCSWRCEDANCSWRLHLNGMSQASSCPQNWVLYAVSSMAFLTDWISQSWVPNFLSITQHLITWDSQRAQRREGVQRKPLAKATFTGCTGKLSTVMSNTASSGIKFITTPRAKSVRLGTRVAWIWMQHQRVVNPQESQQAVSHVDPEMHILAMDHNGSQDASVQRLLKTGRQTPVKSRDWPTSSH